MWCEMWCGVWCDMCGIRCCGEGTRWVDDVGVGVCVGHGIGDDDV